MLALITESNYQAHRHNIKSGDLLAWSSSSLFSRIIRMWTGQTYSHVGVAWVVWDRVFVLEAMDGIGVRIMPLSGRLPFYHIATNIEWTDNRESLALSKIGDQYSYIDAIRAGIGIKTIEKGWQCAEYVAMVLDISDVNPVPGEIVDKCLRTDFIGKSEGKNNNHIDKNLINTSGYCFNDNVPTNASRRKPLITI